MHPEPASAPGILAGAVKSDNQKKHRAKFGSNQNGSFGMIFFANMLTDSQTSDPLCVVIYEI